MVRNLFDEIGSYDLSTDSLCQLEDSMHDCMNFVPSIFTHNTSLSRISTCSSSAYHLCFFAISFDAFICAKKVSCCLTMTSCLLSVMRPAIRISIYLSPWSVLHVCLLTNFPAQCNANLQIVKLCVLQVFNCFPWTRLLTKRLFEYNQQ